MDDKKVDIEFLIREIEKHKRTPYEMIYGCKGLGDPSTLAQHAQYVLGLLVAYDNVIRDLRELQGADDE